MITANKFNKALLDSGVSAAEFARKAGKSKTTIQKYCVSGVPEKDESLISQMIENMKKPIFFGEQTSMIKD